MECVEPSASAEVEGRPSEDAVSFERFFQEHHPQLFGTLCLVTGNPQEAEDLMQEAFLKLWERWDRVASLEDAPGYLYRTAFNLFRSRARRLGRAVRRVTLAPTQDDPTVRVLARHLMVRAVGEEPHRPYHERWLPAARRSAASRPPGDGRTRRRPALAPGR